jgi:long-subunit fatty acid transport protein
MKILSLLIVFLVLNEIYPQPINANVTTYTYNILLFPQGFGIEQLNSKGTSTLFNNIANLNGLNPSAISQFENLSFGLSYQFQTKIPDAFGFGFGLSRTYAYIPQSLGFIYKSDQLCFGFGFDQRYNGKPEMDPIPITTMDQPDGTGQYISPEYRQMLQRYSLSGAYTFKGIFEANSELSIGIRLNLNRFSDYESLGSFSAEGIFWKESFEAGLNYFYSFNEQEQLTFGFSYGNRLEMSGDLKYNAEPAPIRYTDSSTSRGPTYYNFQAPSATVNFPAQLKFDLLYQYSSAITIAGNLTYINWEEINSNISNQPEYSVSLIYSADNSISGSIGIYHSDYTYKTDIFSLTEQMEAFYLTAGTSFNINSLNFDIALADSHLFSETSRKQTIVKIGMGLNF